MKPYLRRFSVLFCILLLCIACLPACQSAPSNLLDHGMDVIAIMSDMVSNDQYAELMMGNINSVNEHLQNLKSEDYSKPSAVYEVSVPAESLLKVLTGSSKDALQMSDRLQDYVLDSTYSSFISTINSEAGVSALTVSSVLCAQLTFEEKIDQNTIYLYVFDQAVIAVTFLKGEDQTVRALGHFVLSESLAVTNEEDMATSLNKIKAWNVTVKKIA